MKPQTKYELWQRRMLGVGIPLLLAFLLITDALDEEGLNSVYTPLLLVLLASYGSGLTAYVIKRVIGKSDDGDTDK